MEIISYLGYQPNKSKVKYDAVDSYESLLNIVMK